jgi:hypothetical protein
VASVDEGFWFWCSTEDDGQVVRYWVYDSLSLLRLYMSQSIARATSEDEVFMPAEESGNVCLHKEFFETSYFVFYPTGCMFE